MNIIKDQYETPAEEIVKQACEVQPDCPVSEVMGILAGDEPLSSIVVVKNKKPIGLVMRIHIDRLLSHEYGFSLYYRKPIRKLMDKSPMIVDYKTALEEIASLAMKREKSKLYDHIIVTRKGCLLGLISVQGIMEKLVLLQQKRSFDLERVNNHLEKEINGHKETINKLEQSFKEIRTLRGILPICASCKKIRDDKGYWNQIESYIRRYSEAEFSHSICPECSRKLYPEFYTDDN